MKVLIIKLSSLGDLIHAVPAVSLIKQVLPTCQIDWLVYKTFSAILEENVENKILNKIIVLEDKTAAAYTETMRVLKQEEYDLIIDMQSLFKTAALAFMSKAKKTDVIGFRKPREIFSDLFYNTKVANYYLLDNSKHVIEKNLDLAIAALSKITKSQINNKGRVNYPILKNSAQALPSQLKISDEYFNICLIMGTTWESKLWSEEYWIQLLDYLVLEQRQFNDKPIKIYFVGTKSDLPSIGKVIRSAERAALRGAIVNLVDKLSLRQLGSFFQRMELIIGLDTGPLHYAAATVNQEKTSIIGLYGPSSAARSGPYGFDAISVDQCFGEKASHKRSLEADRGSMHKITPAMLQEKIRLKVC